MTQVKGRACLWYPWAIDRDEHVERDRRWLWSQVDAEDVDTLAQ